MKHNIAFLAAVVMAVTFSSCGRESMPSLTHRVFDTARQQCLMMDARLAPDSLPKTYQDGRNVDSDILWWCSGFFPGTLWYVYEYTGDETILALARKNTAKLENLWQYPTHHDIGFQINDSYGNGFRLTKDTSYLDIMEKSVAKLAARFNPVIGTIKSWDNTRGGRWSHPVIIDNMMNLEFLLNGANIFGADSLRDIACTHAYTTMRNHFRSDYTTWHVVDYNLDGTVHEKVTHQGYSDDSAWARGQSWAIYGYAMMYRYTGNRDFLNQAENVAAMLMERLPKDGIPYWDFDSPEIPDDLRDASAGAVMACGFADLAALTDDASKAQAYRKMAEKQLRTLASEEYLAKPGQNGCFILKHSVGHKPGNSEVDVPLTYADYYFLEALLKFAKLDK